MKRSTSKNSMFDDIKKIFCGLKKLLAQATYTYKNELAKSNICNNAAKLVIFSVLAYITVIFSTYRTFPLIGIITPIFTGAVVYILSAAAFKLTDKINYKTYNSPSNTTPAWHIVFYIVSLLWWRSITSEIPIFPDTESQWLQIMSGKFNDWHPIIHTGYMWLITRIYCNLLFVMLVEPISK